MGTLKQWIRDWWGLLAPALIFLVSDMGLPDDAPWWVSWMALAVSVGSYLIGRWNGMLSAREASGLDAELEQLRSEIGEKDTLLSQKDEQIAKLDGELSAIKGNLQSLIDEQQDREDEEQERDEARQVAMVIKPDNKLLLLELAKGESLTVSMNRYAMENHIIDLYGLVEHTEVGLDAQELWISDYGMRVVELAGDILSKVRPDAVYPWWQQARFLSVEQGDPQPQEESDQGPLSSWPWPISADDIEPTN